MSRKNEKEKTKHLLVLSLLRPLFYLGTNVCPMLSYCLMTEDHLEMQFRWGLTSLHCIAIQAPFPHSAPDLFTQIISKMFSQTHENFKVLQGS